MKLPSSFTDYTRALLGVEEYEKLAAALEGEQPVSIRLNEDKLPESSFSLFRSSFRHVPWSTAGYYLDKRLTFTFDPLFHAGCYYVQEASSMFCAILFAMLLVQPLLADIIPTEGIWLVMIPALYMPNNSL